MKKAVSWKVMWRLTCYFIFAVLWLLVGTVPARAADSAQVTELTPPSGTFLHGIVELEAAVSPAISPPPDVVFSWAPYDSLDGGAFTIPSVPAEDGVARAVYAWDTASLPDGRYVVGAWVYGTPGEAGVWREYYVDNTAPQAVQGLTAEGQPGAVLLSWSWSGLDVRGGQEQLAFFRVYRAGPDEEFQVVGELKEAEVLAYEDTNVEVGVTYRYQVTVVDLAGNESEPVEAGGQAAAPASGEAHVAQILPESKYQHGIVTLEAWVEGAGDPLPDVCFWVAGPFSGEPPSRGLSWQFLARVPSQREGEVVRAVYAWDTTGFADGTWAVNAYVYRAGVIPGDEAVYWYVVDNTVPEAVSGLAAQPEPGSIRLSWSWSGLDAAGRPEQPPVCFRIERNPPWLDGGGPVLLWYDVPPSPVEYTDTSVAEGTHYTYRVTVLDAAGNESAAREAVAAPLPLARPDPPYNLTAEWDPIGYVVRLSWQHNQPSSLRSFRVYRQEAGGARELVGEVEAPVTSWVDAPLPGRLYRYAVTAVGQKGVESLLSAEASVNTPDTSPPVIARFEPGSGATLDGLGEIAFTVEASDPGRVARLQLTYMCQDHTTFYGTVGVWEGTPAAYVAQTFRWLRNQQLPSGRYIVALTVRDAAGNEALQTRYYYIYDLAAPFGVVTYPVADGVLEVSWYASAGDEFRLFRSRDAAGPYELVAEGLKAQPQPGVGGRSNLWYRDSGLDPGVRYFYRVQACSPLASGGELLSQLSEYPGSAVPDVSPPSVEVTKSVFRDLRCRIEGTVSDNGAIDYVALSRAGSGVWDTAELDRAGGRWWFDRSYGGNFIEDYEVLARDQASNEARKSFRVVVDLEPPLVDLPVPAEGAVVNGTPEVFGRAYDLYSGLGPGCVSVSVGGRTWTVDPVAAVDLQGRACWEFSWRLPREYALRPGTYPVTVEVCDLAGNETRIERRVEVSYGGPSVFPQWYVEPGGQPVERVADWERPDYAFPPEFTLRVVASDCSGAGVDPGSVSAVLDGQAAAFRVEVVDEGTLVVYVDTGWLGNGEHSLEVRARDRMGMEGGWVLSFRSATYPPEVILLFPQEGTKLKGEVTVEAAVYDRSRTTIRAVYGYVDGREYEVSYDSSTNRARWQVFLDHGRHTFTVVAVDGVGRFSEASANAEVLQRIYVRDPATDIDWHGYRWWRRGDWNQPITWHFRTTAEEMDFLGLTGGEIPITLFPFVTNTVNGGPGYETKIKVTVKNPVSGASLVQEVDAKNLTEVQYPWAPNGDGYITHAEIRVPRYLLGEGTGGERFLDLTIERLPDYEYRDQAGNVWHPHLFADWYSVFIGYPPPYVHDRLPHWSVPPAVLYPNNGAVVPKYAQVYTYVEDASQTGLRYIRLFVDGKKEFEVTAPPSPYELKRMLTLARGAHTLQVEAVNNLGYRTLATSRVTAGPTYLWQKIYHRQPSSNSDGLYAIYLLTDRELTTQEAAELKGSYLWPGTLSRFGVRGIAVYEERADGTLRQVSEESLIRSVVLAAQRFVGLKPTPGTELPQGLVDWVNTGKDQFLGEGLYQLGTLLGYVGIADPEKVREPWEVNKALILGVLADQAAYDNLDAYLYTSGLFSEVVAGYGTVSEVHDAVHDALEDAGYLARLSARGREIYERAIKVNEAVLQGLEELDKINGAAAVWGEALQAYFNAIWEAYTVEAHKEDLLRLYPYVGGATREAVQSLLQFNAADAVNQMVSVMVENGLQMAAEAVYDG